MNIKLHEWLRLVGVPILIRCLLAWVFAPAYSKENESKVYESIKTATPQPTVSTHEQEIRKLLDELQERARENYTMVLEGQRKTMDWWFSFLAFITAVLAIFGALIPPPARGKELRSTVLTRTLSPRGERG